MVFRGGNGISLLGITYYAIVDIDGKYVMVEMLLSAAPFGDVSHTRENILRVSKQHFARYGVGEYESAISALSAKIVVHKDSVLDSVHMKVTDNAANIKKAFSFFDGGFCFLHTLELVVQGFMADDAVSPWFEKIQGICRHLKISMSGWLCFVELCEPHGLNCTKPPIGGRTRWGGHYLQVLWHTEREIPMSEYYAEGPKAAIGPLAFCFVCVRICVCVVTALSM